MILTLLLGLLQLVQQELPTSQIIDTQDGLSNNIVYETYQDSEGFIWIATDNGLNRYDGYDFKTFYHHPEDSTSISSNIVRTLLEDTKGNLWIGTFNGLNIYDRATESFTRYDDSPDIPNQRLDVQHFALDSRGLIWFNTLRTIGWFDTNSLEFGFIDPLYPASTMALDDQDQVWMTSKRGSYDRFVLNENTITSIKETNTTLMQPLYWGKYSESLWIKEASLKNNFDIKTSVLPKLPNDVFARELLEVDENTLWIGTDIGLFIYYVDQAKLETVDLGNASTLNSAIRSIYRDKNGGMWVGTLSGLFHFDSFQKPFVHLDIVDESGDVIMGLESVDQQIYINALGKGLYTYNTESGIVKPKAFNKNPPTGYNFIWTIASMPASNYPLWLATDAGLVLYEPITGNWKHINLSIISGTNSPSFSIIQTDKFAWVSSKEGIHLLSKKDGQIIKSIPLSEYTKASIIQDLALIDQHLFIATEGVGTILYNVETEEVKMLTELVPDSGVISSTPTWDLFPDGHKLWLGTNRGLFLLDLKTNEFEHIQIDQNFENRVIFSIEKDENETLWMGTERGLMSYNIDKNEIRYYDTNDGLKNIEYNRKSVKKTSDGRLLFGGVNGITLFDPSRIQQNAIVPPVYITELEVITSDSTFYPSLKEGQTLKLPWHQNTIQLYYVALNYTNSAQNQYKYRLVGHDPDWVLDEGTRQARYVRLPPGTYTFEVMGSNNDALWNPASKTIAIEILPPYWQRWWFRALIILGIALILWSAYRYRVKRLLAVERMRLRIAGDLHDEVGSGLSGIALTGDLLQRQVEKGAAKPELVERITNNARNLASSLDAIVWLIDPQKESLGDLLVKIRAVGSELLTQSKFQMVEHITEADKERSLSAEQKRNLFLLIKEGLHNIAKHANATNAALTISCNHTTLSLSLVDNGDGFNLEEKGSGHGLESVKNRAHLLKAEFHFNSIIGKGTEIHLKMKLP